jgi:hypothetical protein
MARLRLWLVMLPLVAAGTEGAASLVDTFAPKRYETVELFSRSNASHNLLPLAAALGAALLLCALYSFATSAPAARRPPRLMFACLPSLAFALQEHVEYVVGHDQVPWTLVIDPTFAAGLLLLIPLTVAAYLLARLLVEAAVAIGERVSTARVAPQRAAMAARPGRDALGRLHLVDRRRHTRGPPQPLAA